MPMIRGNLKSKQFCPHLQIMNVISSI